MADIEFLDETSPIAFNGIDPDTASPRGAPWGRCGAPVEAGDRFCVSCGQSSSEAPQRPAATAQVRPDQTLIQCKNCGAEIATKPNQRSYVCPFCDSTYVSEISRRDTNRQEPEFVIGFAVTPEQALRHPNWEMGARITIDSATMMNKGLEIIEAHHLFSIPPERIEVVVHPQSIVHSMVEFHDGSWLAQLGPPDMRIAIRYALGYPERLAAPHSDFSLSQIAQLTFEEPDHHSFPSLELAYRACRRGGTLPAVLNAADEIAVDGFLAEKIAFNGIFEVVERALNEHEVGSADDWNQLLTADRQTRERVTSWIS